MAETRVGPRGRVVRAISGSTVWSVSKVVNDEKAMDRRRTCWVGEASAEVEHVVEGEQGWGEGDEDADEGDEGGDVHGSGRTR